MHRGGREGGANYLQVVTKDTLEDQVGLSISIVRLASRGGIQLASLKEIFFLFQMQLSAKCLVIFQLTISILGVLRRQRIPLPTDPHTGTGVISGIGIGRSGMSGIGSSNCSKSNNSSSSSSNNVGRPALAQSYTNLGRTQDSGPLFGCPGHLCATHSAGYLNFATAAGAMAIHGHSGSVVVTVTMGASDA